MSDPRPLNEIMEEFAARSLWEVPHATEEVAAAWQRIAVPGLAAHCWVGSLVEGNLQLCCDTPVWAQEVQMISADLVARLNHELGHPVVRNIVVTLRRRRDRGQGSPRV